MSELPEVLVRPARREDLDGMLALCRALQPEDPVPARGKAEAAWAALLGNGLATVLVAECAGTLAASCTLVLIPNLTRDCRPYALIENVVTLEGHRRRGLGRRVLRAAIARAREAGCYKVMLATGSKQEATLRFYEGVGLERGGKTYFQARWN